MEKDQKVRRMREWVADIGVWLDLDNSDTLYATLSFDDEPYVRFGKRLFHLTYAGFPFPFKRFPFTDVKVVKTDPPGTLRMRWPTLEFENDDKPAQTIYSDSPSEKRANTLEFWNALYERTHKLKDEARQAIWPRLKGLKIKEAYQAAQVWWGCRTWIRDAEWFRELPKIYVAIIGGWKKRDRRVTAQTVADARVKLEDQFGNTPPERREYKFWLESDREVGLHK